MSKKQKRPPRERPAEQITAEKLRVLFEQKVAPGPIKGRVRLRMPGDAELKKLADRLEAWRRSYQYGDALDELREKRKSAKAALGNFAAAATQYQKVTGLPLAEWLFEMDNARVIMERAMDAIAPDVPGPQKWKAIAKALTALLTAAMQPVNPGWKLGVSHAGPTVRFVAAVVPLITGETPSPQSVSTQLKNWRTKQKQAEADLNRWIDQEIDFLSAMLREA